LDDPRESQVTFMARGCWDVPPKIYDVNARKTSEGPSRANMFHLFAWHILASMKLVHPLRKDPDRPLSSPMKLQQISGKWLGCASWENDSGSTEPSRLMIVVYHGLSYSIINI
jgi:hypothetical protein